MALKIKLDGEKVPPEVMDLLIRFAQHRDLCDECLAATKSGSGRYCPTGAEMFRELLKHPSVQYTEEPPTHSV